MPWMDGLVWSVMGACHFYKNIYYLQRRVMVDSAAAFFVCKKKSIFAKFVIKCDSNI
jgi:archaeosine-15-forming tRNA-guanine transglycosylase